MSNERRSQQAVKPERPEPVPQLAELAETNKRLKRKIFDLYTIFEISRHLNSVLNTQTLLDAIILTCIGQMGVNGAAIFIVRGQGSDELALAKHKGLSLPPSRELLIAGDSPVFRLFHESHGKPLSFDEIRSTIGETPEVAVLSSVECAYLIPMSLQGRIRGLLSVTRKISGAGFLDDDLEFLSILANQLSVAIENARLFDSEKEALEKLRTTQLQLVQAEKLAALGQLSARVAHEVNNPLGIIKNYLLMIRQQCNQDKDAEKFVEIVTEEVDRIAGIVRQLLDMFRPQPDTFGSTDVGAVLEETLLLLSLHAQKGRIKIDKKLPRQFPRIYGSAEQLKQVFLNILINACDFMPRVARSRSMVLSWMVRLLYPSQTAAPVSAKTTWIKSSNRSLLRKAPVEAPVWV